MMARMDENAERETLQRLYVEEGLTTGEIAARFGVAVETVRKRLEQHGIPRRQAGPAKRLLVEAEEKSP